ncbi:MAG: N-6 DNA methylase [Gemmatimonadetes bacterium]|nr:N-6 DNA methylase [Gemmatimonadota bacterium]
MAGTDRKLIAAAEAYFAELGRVRASGGATGERSNYPALAGLLNGVGATLKPKVFCVQELADQGAGHPDFALYAARQVQRGRPKRGQIPERGVVEVKGVEESAEATRVSEQVDRYWGRYRQVLVTNLREFALLGTDDEGGPSSLESFRLAESADDFWHRVGTPRKFAREVGVGLGEYLARSLAHGTALAEPKDLAWLLASYARDGLARVEAAGSVPSLVAVRAAMEEALGIRFEDERGERFFRSTLVQTLFYGVFAAWVLWSCEQDGMTDALRDSTGSARGGRNGSPRFRWREAVWHLRAPVLRALFQQLADPGRLKPLGLVEVLDWTSAALDRVDRTAFFSRFNEGEAVPYFYEPFLEAFDPVLRKQLGVWYTPTEVVRYMVARVDGALKDDLGIPAGLAAEHVYVLDPCCGTGAYLAEVLRRISRNLGDQGLGALSGAAVRRAATERVFGFEIMPAPFVVAHFASRSHHAESGCTAGGGRVGAGRGVSHQRADRLGAAGEQAVAVPGTRRRARTLGSGETGRPDPGDPRQPALQRVCGNGGGRGTRTLDSLPHDGTRAEAPRPRPERSLRQVLPHGGAAHRREDGPGRGLLHLQLLVARRAVLHRDAGAVSGSVRRDPDRQPTWRPHHFGIRPRRKNQRDGFRGPREVAGHQGRYQHHPCLQVWKRYPQRRAGPRLVP